MKGTRNSLIAFAVALVTLVATDVTAQPLAVTATGTKKVTLNNAVGANQFTWVSDAPLEKIKGTAEGVSGSFTIDPKNLSTIKGSISAKVSTMTSGNGTRDGHLKSANWLDAAKYPTIGFTIASVSGITVKGNKATGKATGTFTMHGVSKQMTIPFELTYVDASEKTRKRAEGDLVMISADFAVSLKDFNVQGSKGFVGSKVGESIKVTAKLFGSTGN
jgi:polyisoprenoid-binding protein YceI